MGLKRICIAIRSFERPLMGKNFLGPYARRIGLPESRVLYTVLRSPHIDKKSREQFEMVIKKQLVVLKTKTNEELRKKLFWLKRLRIVGAQYEVLFDSETRLDKGKLKAVLEQCHTTGPLEPLEA